MNYLGDHKREYHAHQLILSLQSVKEGNPLQENKNEHIIFLLIILYNKQ